MDSRNLHIAFRHMLSTVAWDRHGEHEYVLVGDGIGFDRARLQSLVDATFKDPQLHLSLDRHVGFIVARQDAATRLLEHMEPNSNVTITDSNLHVFLQVSSTGVARTGTAQANNSFKPNPHQGGA